MQYKLVLSMMGTTLLLWGSLSSAGIVDPDCSAKKAGKKIID